MNENKTNKPFRGILALILICLGCLSLWLSGFAPGHLLKGPKVITSVSEESAYVQMDIGSIIGFYAQETISGHNDAKVKYALVPMDDKLVTVRIPLRYFESADYVYSSTLSYINAGSKKPDSFFTVTGSVSLLKNEPSTMLYDWFALNLDQIQAVGITSQVEDFADHLSEYVLDVDTINGVQIVKAVAFTIASLLCFAASIPLIISVFSSSDKSSKKTSELDLNSNKPAQADVAPGNLNASTASEAETSSTTTDTDDFKSSANDNTKSAANAESNSINLKFESETPLDSVISELNAASKSDNNEDSLDA